MKAGDIIKVGRLVFGIRSIFNGTDPEQTASESPSIKLSDLNHDYYTKETSKGKPLNIEID